MANSKMDVDMTSSEDWAALRSAVILQNPTLILNLLKQNVDFRCTDKDGNTVLHLIFKKYTVDNNQRLIIQILNIFLYHGMDPNVMNNEGKTALHLAIKSRLCDVINFLIKRGANLNIRDQDGDSVAHFVIDSEFDQFCGTCWSESYEASEKQYAKSEGKHFVRWLLSKGLNVNYKNNDGIIPLHLAARLNLQFIMFELLNCTDDYRINYINSNNQNILHSLLESFTQNEPMGFKNEKKSESIPFREDKTIFLHIVKSLLEKGISVDVADKNGDTPFHLALKLAETDVTNMMVKKFTNVNACDSDGNTVLHIALMVSNYFHFHIYDNYVKILLARGANVHVKNNSGLVPLQIAALSQRANAMKILKEYDANFEVIHDNGNLLHCFTTYRLPVMTKANSRLAIDVLVSQGCDVDRRDTFGMTPLHLALRSCNVHAVNRLIEYGADMRTHELFEKQYTTLHLAAIHGYEDHIDMFVKTGVNVNALDATGRTPLHLSTHNTKIMTKLLRLGAYVDLYDSENSSPLHMALRHENLDAVKVLLHHGADINDVNIRSEIESLIDNKNIAIVIILHWMKLKNLGLPVNETFRDWIGTYFKMNNSSFRVEAMKFRELCAKELQSLKEQKMSWYNFLHMNYNRQSAFVKTNEFKRKSFVLFPIYASVIAGAYHQAKARIPLLKLAVSAWYEATDYYLPDVCVEQIYSHLNNANLRDVINSVQNENT